jgi:hypothetical protein
VRTVGLEESDRPMGLIPVPDLEPRPGLQVLRQAGH